MRRRWASTRRIEAEALVEAADALLVDLDGTLVDSSGPVRRAWDAFAHRHALDPEDVHRFGQGRPSRETVRLLVPDADTAAEADALERAEVGDTAGVVALPGSHELFRARRPLAIVTSCSRALATVRLHAAGLPTPRVLVSSDDVDRGKPDPACYLIAARLLAVDPAACLAIEDAPAGVAAARAAGTRVIALRTTHHDQDLRAADTIVDDLSVIT